MSANLGWRSTHRDVTLGNLTTSESDTQNTNTAIGNIRVRPVDQINFFFDYERGQSDNVFVQVSPLDFQRVRARASYVPTDKLSFSGTISATDRTNPTRFVENQSDYRSISFSALWEPKGSFFINAGYNFDDIVSTGNIYIRVSNVTQTGKSRYYAKQDFFFFDTRVPITKYVDFMLVYRYINDRGAPSGITSTGPYDFVTAFPLKRHNPEARLAMHLSRHATLNVSWRNFSYNERNFAVQDYHSNIMMSSLRITF